jgi:hypothetical protein
MTFRSYEDQFDHQTLAWARHVHDSLFGSMPLEWTRRGTWVEAWVGSRRIAFTPHQSGASIYFQGPGPVESYREWGGRCRTGRVSIRVPIGSDFEAALLRLVVAEYLELPG